MTKEEYFKEYYPGLEWIDLSNSYKLIQNALWEAYDEDGGVKDFSKLKMAYNLCVPIYNKLKDYEEQIRYDIDEFDGKHGSSTICQAGHFEIVDCVQDMWFICRTFHEYFEFVDSSFFEDITNKSEEASIDKIDEPAEVSTEQEGNNRKDKLLVQEVTNEVVESSKIVKEDIEVKETKLIKDENPEHKKWFVEILKNKIPKGEVDRNSFLFKSLNCLFDELCDKECLEPKDEDRLIFIYRFSGLNRPFPPEKKIKWKGKIIILGYIARCLLSDRSNSPMAFGTVASFFILENGKEPTNLASAKNCEVMNFEKEKDNLNPNFVKVVELLRKCGFEKVEFTSSRR